MTKRTIILTVCALASLGWTASAQATPPNVIVVLTDDQAAFTTDLMPYLSSRSDWTSFDSAYDNNALCCPSRATILSGLYSHHTGVENNTLADRFDPTNTIATDLNDAGYATGLFGKYLNAFPWGLGPAAPPGWDSWLAFNGDPNYYDYTLDDDGVDRDYGDAASDYSTDVLGQRAVNFVRNAPEPFFTYYAPDGPHKPYTPAPGDEHVYDALNVPFDSPSFNTPARHATSWWAKRDKVDRTKAREVVRSQAETTLSEDRQLAAMFAALSQRGALDNTVVLFMSDNGFSVGDHRWLGKRCPYEECGHVPMLLRLPSGGVEAVTTPVTNVDVAATLRAVAGVPQEPTDGENLLPLATGQEPGDANRAILIRNKKDDSGPNVPNMPSYWGMRTEHWKYVEYGNGERELFDLHADLDETNNLAGMSKSKRDSKGITEVMAQLHAKLEQMKASAAQSYATKIASP